MVILAFFIFNFIKKKKFQVSQSSYSPFFVLGSKNLGFYVFRTLMCIVGKPWSKQYV